MSPQLSYNHLSAHNNLFLWLFCLKEIAAQMLIQSNKAHRFGEWVETYFVWRIAAHSLYFILQSEFKNLKHF